MGELPWRLTNRAQNRRNSVTKCAIFLRFPSKSMDSFSFRRQKVGGVIVSSIIGLCTWQALGSTQATRHIGLPTIYLKELEIPSSARSRHFPPLSSFSTDRGTL